ncbi:Sec61beta family protein, partial [Teladorsagia circumcincta]
MSDTGRSPRPAGSQLRQRRGGGAAAASSGRARAGNSGGLWRFYTEDSTGLKIGPVPVLVMSLKTTTGLLDELNFRLRKKTFLLVDYDDNLFKQ